MQQTYLGCENVYDQCHGGQELYYECERGIEESNPRQASPNHKQVYAGNRDHETHYNWSRAAISI